VEAVTQVRPAVAPEPRFVLDVHLGRLAQGLRLLGFDAYFGPEFDDPDLARISIEQDRILLTRDRGLLKRGGVVHGYHPRSSDPQEQLIEVLHRFDLFDTVAPFSRCLRCNSEVDRVSKDAVLPHLEARTAELFDEFYRCRGCERIFWKGSHYDAMLQAIERVRQEPRRRPAVP
jgi:uncharacterized protein with PIN domain